MDISGKDVNKWQFENIEFISITFSVFHLDISGNDVNDEHSEKALLILVTL